MIATKIEAKKVLMVMGMGENMPSPCMSVCRMDEASGLCEGCLRTLEEIACWSTMPESSKRAIWMLIGQRVAARQETLP